MTISRTIVVELHGTTEEDYQRILTILTVETPETQGWTLNQNHDTNTVTAAKTDSIP